MQHHIPNSEPSVTPEWRPIAELKARFGFSRTTCNRLIAEQLVEARKLGGRTLVNIPSVHRYMASLPRPVIKRDDRSAKLARRAA
jgi:hypothetical protein